MRDALAEFERHIHESNIELARLLPPATGHEIVAAERALKVEFPSDIRTLYQWHNGSKDDFFFFAGYRLFDLHTLVSLHTRWVADFEPEDLEVRDESGVFKDCIVSRKWIALGDNGGNTLLYLDMDPGKTGVAGQILEACDGEPECRFKGVRELIVEANRMLVSGEL